MTPVRGDDEKYASEGERNACDDRSRRRHLEGWDLSGDEPDTGKQDQQESDLREGDTRLTAESEHGRHGSDSDRSVLIASLRIAPRKHPEQTTVRIRLAPRILSTSSVASRMRAGLCGNRVCGQPRLGSLLG